jgi:flagellar protein FliS
MPQSPYDNYLESQILSATPVQLVVILFRAAIDSLETARVHLKAGDIRARTAATNRATSVIAELAQSMDLTKGGEVAANLMELYDYILRRVHIANAKADDTAYAETIGLLSTVLEGWQVVAADSEPVQNEVEEREPIECLF